MSNTPPPGPPSQDREEALFAAALGRPISERAAFLDGACHGEPALRQRLETLLAAHEEPATMLATHVLAGRPDLKTEFDEEAADEAVGQTIGRYKLLEKVGEGGCGVVYVAEQTEPVRRRVALKVIKLGMDTKQVVARFEAERQALAMMDHPNIAKVLDAGTTETGRPYFVMELVRGIRITDYCDQAKLSTKERLDLFIKVCQAIQHAHQKGIIHRDIKPSNILVTLHDGVPVPKVIDFGIAKATEGRLTDATVYTQLHQFIGTPAYMSPEQAEMSGLDIDTRSDIYSLGVLLYELLAGSTPFDAKELLASGIDAMRRTIREQDPVRPSTRLATLKGEELTTTAKRRSVEMPKLLHQLKGDLDWIVMKCLEKDRARRYDTANGLAMDITRHLTDEPVIARPPSAAYKFEKAFRRNKVVFTAAMAVAVALVTGIGVSTWQATVATRAKNQAVRAEAAKEHERDKAVAAQKKETTERKRAEVGEYTAKMNLAKSAWDQNNVGRMRQLLEETAAYPERGFEWSYLERLTHLEIRTFRGHFRDVCSVAFSPDGRLIVTGGRDNMARMWEADSGKEIHLFKGHSRNVRAVAFSADGRLLVTGSYDKTAKVWDVASGDVLRTLDGNYGWVMSVAISPDGKRIVTGGQDGVAEVWETATGKRLRELKGHGNSIWSVAFSPDGQRIVTGCGDFRRADAQVWQADTGKAVLTLDGHKDTVSSVAYSRDGRWIVTGSTDFTAKLWDAASGKELLPFIGHSAGIWCVAFSSDGRRIVTGSNDQTAKVWETVSGKELFTFKGHSAIIFAVAFSPDGQRIVTTSGDHTARLWETTENKEVLTLRKHTSYITSVAFSPDGRRIVTGSNDRSARVWEASTGTELFTLNGHSNEVNSVAFSPDGLWIVTGCQDRMVRVCEASTGANLYTLIGHNNDIHSVAFSPDGRQIVTGNRDATAEVWDIARRTNITLEGHSNVIHSVAFSPHGKRIVTGSYDGTAKVWEASTGKNMATLKGSEFGVMSAAFSPDGKRIITGGFDGTALVWEAASGKKLLSLTAHNNIIRSVAFSLDGRRIVTGSGDHSAKVWDAASGKELLTLTGHSGDVSSVAFSRDGQQIVTGSWDGTAKVWTAATSQQVAVWQQEEKTAAEQEKAAADSLKTLPREQQVAAAREQSVRENDAGAIKQWLVLAPIGFAGKDGAVALQQEQIPNEAQLRPRAGDRVKVGETERVWNAVQQKDYVIDFNRLLGEEIEYSVAYTVCYVHSETDQAGLVMMVGSDDQSKVFLNGLEIHRRSVGRAYIADQDLTPGVELKAGTNVLVFKVVNEVAGWKGSVRFTDASDQPVKGIRVTLDPSQ